MASEFELIARHFTRPTRHTILGVGDDAALVQPRPGMQLVVTTDLLAAGTHFLADTDPANLGWKSLAVNLSDLAAMGAEPRWAVIAAALPEPDEAWIAAFARGLFEAAERFDVDVIGGDTTRGPLTLCPTVFGEVPAGGALTRGAGRPGDDVWISGQPGRAALGLAQLRQAARLAPDAAGECIAALERPLPRVALGLALRGLARAAIDMSDGLLADLGHILERSALGAELELERLPLAPLVAAGGDRRLALDCLLGGGDDYELIFTAAPTMRSDIEALSAKLDLPLHRIGCLVDGAPVTLVRDAEGRPVTPGRRGYEHFAD